MLCETDGVANASAQGIAQVRLFATGQFSAYQRTSSLHDLVDNNDNDDDNDNNYNNNNDKFYG